MPNTTDAPALFSLNDEPYDVKNPAEDVRNRTVVDRNGEEIGSVDDLLIDDREHKVRFLRIKEGGLLGIGVRYRLIPVDAVTRITEDTVAIDQTGEQVGSGPEYDPTVAADDVWRREAFGEDGYYPSLYQHYGYSPFWAPGYVYPGYPFHI
jgi:sporulation protein YlmC with PRC-barrel domain